MAAIVFGSIPLWRGASAAALHETGRGNTASRQRHHVRHLLLGAQVAMALVLLVASGLMVRSLQNLRAIDPGFNPDSTLTFNLALPPTKYRSIDSMVAVHQGVIDRVAALPGVTSVSATTCLPLSMGCNGNTLLVEGDVYPPGTLPPLSLFRAVGGGYFETMGMRILRGRGIDRARCRSQGTGCGHQPDARRPGLQGPRSDRPPHCLESAARTRRDAHAQVADGRRRRQRYADARAERIGADADDLHAAVARQRGDITRIVAHGSRHELRGADVDCRRCRSCPPCWPPFDPSTATWLWRRSRRSSRWSIARRRS